MTEEFEICGIKVQKASRLELLLARLCGMKMEGRDGDAVAEFRYWRGRLYLVRVKEMAGNDNS